MRRLLLTLAISLLLAGHAGAAKVDADWQRLQAQLAQLDADPALEGFAALERLKARQALENLQMAKSSQRAHALLLAERRVQTAVLAVESERLNRQSLELDRERDRLQLEISRRETDLARRETERLRLLNLARQEEAERLALQVEAERLAREEQEAEAAESEQARKLAEARAREAELARQEAELAAALGEESAADAPLPAKSSRGSATVYTLAGDAFASGRADLTAAAQASLRRLAAELAGAGGAIVIEGHTDSQGSDQSNQKLSEARAVAVKTLLAGAGVAASRLQAVGLGESAPLADNLNEAGRARNRRVEIVVK